MKFGFLRTILIALVLSSLNGCALFMHAPPSPELYTISPIHIAPTHYRSHLTVLVLPPQPSAELTSMKMIYVKKKHQISYYAKNKWAGAPAQLLMPVIAQALSDSKAFHAVVTPPYIGNANIRVDTQLLMLQQEFLSNPSRVRMVLSAQVIRISDGKVLAAKRFWAVVPAPGNDPYSGVIAANRATALIVPKLTHFVIAATQVGFHKHNPSS